MIKHRFTECDGEMFGYHRLTTPEAKRGFWLLLIATLSVGMAMAIQQNIVTVM